MQFDPKLHASPPPKGFESRVHKKWIGANRETTVYVPSQPLMKLGGLIARVEGGLMTQYKERTFFSKPQILKQDAFVSLHFDNCYDGYERPDGSLLTTEAVDPQKCEAIEGIAGAILQKLGNGHTGHLVTNSVVTIRLPDNTTNPVTDMAALLASLKEMEHASERGEAPWKYFVPGGGFETKVNPHLPRQGQKAPLRTWISRVFQPKDAASRILGLVNRYLPMNETVSMDNLARFSRELGQAIADLSREKNMQITALVADFFKAGLQPTQDDYEFFANNLRDILNPERQR